MDVPYCQKHHNTVGVATCKLCVIDELKRQRDELLAALNWFIKQMPEPSVPDTNGYFAGYQRALAAIAKVKP